MLRHNAFTFTSKPQARKFSVRVEKTPDVRQVWEGVGVSQDFLGCARGELRCAAMALVVGMLLWCKGFGSPWPGDE